MDATSDWTELHPALFALFSLLRPRRYVGLGVHEGSSFFAACQASKNLGLTTQCVAVDPWIDAESVFEQFRRQVEDKYQTHHFIRGSLAHALKCFDDRSIDLLHLDTYHSYGASVEDFASWLPKLSSKGTMIFHDVNVYRRECGLWRLWDELKQRYPGYLFYHTNGLGILYVGDKDHVLRRAIEVLNSNREYATLAQLFFAHFGEHDSHRVPAFAGRIDPFFGSEYDENVQKLAAVLKSGRTARAFRHTLRRSLWVTRAKYWLNWPANEKRKRYTKRKREFKATPKDW